MNPEISIVIPTHNRRAMLLLILDALARQTADPQSYEVIVVADGCQDDTVTAVKKLSPPYRLTLVEQPPSGPAAARNRGAESASTPILLFLDDDVEPEPEFVMAHLNAHEKWPAGVILGYSPYSDESDENNFANINEKIWWSNLFAEQARIDHRFDLWDLTSANVSMPYELFKEIRGFDESFPSPMCEDNELGLRLIKHRVRFRFVREAAAKHHAERPEKSYFRRWLNMGRAHVTLIRKHPEILTAPDIPFVYIVGKPKYPWSLYPNEFLFKLLWLNSAIGKLLAGGFELALNFAKICKNYTWYIKFLKSFYCCQYWRGVQAELGSLATAKQLAKDALKAPIYFNEVAIDLKTDLNHIDEILGQQPVDAVTLHFGNHVIGRIEPVIIRESLRPIHFYRTLINLINNGSIASLVDYNSFLSLLLNSKLLMHFINHESIDNILQGAGNNIMLFGQGWHGVEYWNGIETRWMMDEAILATSSDKICTARLNFRAKSLYHSRILKIYVDNQQVGKWVVPTKFIDIATEISLSRGVDFLRLRAIGGCDKPRYDWKLMTRDTRCLSIAFQNFSLIPCMGNDHSFD